METKAWADTKGPLPLPQPFAKPQEAELGLGHSRGKEGRLTQQGEQDSPEVFFTQPAAWGSPARSEFLQEKPSPDREVSAP